MGQLSRQQWVILIAALANSALVSLFPPYDFISLQRGNVPTFAGFFWLLGGNAQYQINTNFLMLEFFVVLVNASIAWLLTGNNPGKAASKRRFWRQGVLWMVAINLIVIILFPPFENFSAVTKAVLPSFEGFYFVFGDNSQRQLVVPILYIEISVLLINAGLLLLFLREPSQQKLTPQEVQQLAKRLQKQQR